jgi:hypothetical protein
LILFALAIFPFHELVGQQLEIKNYFSSGNEAQFNQNNMCRFRTQYLPALSYIDPRQDYPPFYWVFWTFGNGEYYPKMERTKWVNMNTGAMVEAPKHGWENFQKPEDIQLSRDYLDYTYPNTGSFSPIAIPIDRKGDTPPPAA